MTFRLFLVPAGIWAAIGLAGSSVVRAEHSAVVASEFIFESAPFPQCHASTLAETPTGLVAAWFGGTREKAPDVGIWVSRFESGGWTAPVEAVNGVQSMNVRYPCWNPVLYQPEGGPLLLFYKVGPDPRTWWGMLTTSVDSGRTWSWPVKLGEDPAIGHLLGPVKNKPVKLSDGRLLCPSSSENPETGWRVHFEITRDLGLSWTVIGPINTKEEFNAIQPSVLFHGGGRLQVLCRSQEGVLATSWSDDEGRSWSRMEGTSLPNPNAGTDAVTLSDGQHLLVYNPTTKRPDGKGGPRTPLAVAISSDGVSWSEVLTLEDAPGEYSYPAVIQTADGMVHITYTWRRERIKHVVLDPQGL